MTELPDRIADVTALEELLSRPSQPLIDFIAALEGDILVLGASGKIGPSLARMAQRAVDAAGTGAQVIGVARSPMPDLEAQGVRVIQCDLADLAAVEALPRAENVYYLVGRKFGSTGSEWLTWAANTIVPYHVARTFRRSRLAVFSTGCVYPLAHVMTGGSVEGDPVGPVGEYAMSCLGRERVFDYYAAEHGTAVVQLRLNYAVELRYGVLWDVAQHVWREEPLDVTTGYANVLWQGDVCDQALRSIAHASSPSAVLNITGPELLSIRRLAHRFGEIMGRAPRLVGEENGLAYLSNASRANGLLGNPSVPVNRVIQWVADWVMRGGESLDKPTHYQVQDGQF